MLSEPESKSNKNHKKLINYEKFNPLLQKLIISKLPELISLLNNLKVYVLNGIANSTQGLAMLTFRMILTMPTITKDAELLLNKK